MCISEYALFLQMYIIFANIHYFKNAYYCSPEITKTQDTISLSGPEWTANTHYFH